MNFKYIRNFFDTDERFSYMHDLLENKMDVHIANGQSFIIIQEKYSLFKAIYSLPDNPFLKVSFNISDEESFKDAIEIIYKSATISDDQSKEDKMAEINHIISDYNSITDFSNQPKDIVKYPRGGNTMYKQTVNKSFDFLNDYKVVKLAEKAINDNFAELANDFIKYSNSEEDTGTILSCGNSKVLFSTTKFNRKITIEFGRDGEEPFRYVYTNKGINLLNDYDPAALITIGNLIEAAVESWLEKDRNRMNMEDVNECMISAVDNIKTMIGLINSTIGKYNA
jgi:hypothetical protein|uniref:Uncharacterized protein n=1 Tax=Myoviridae sp. ct6uZ8 TaxID=2827603 RepID=A0A8S5LJK1_9CAUD|nr:MAG TPA: hypothetical protein [Myoviridae sp. ct6uZ8]